MSVDPHWWTVLIGLENFIPNFCLCGRRPILLVEQLLHLLIGGWNRHTLSMPHTTGTLEPLVNHRWNSSTRWSSCGQLYKKYWSSWSYQTAWSATTYHVCTSWIIIDWPLILSHTRRSDNRMERHISWSTTRTFPVRLIYQTMTTQC